MDTYDRRGHRVWGGTDAKLLRGNDGRITVHAPTGQRLGLLVPEGEMPDASEASPTDVGFFQAAVAGAVLLLVFIAIVFIGSHVLAAILIALSA